MILNKYKEKMIKNLTLAKKTKKDSFLSKIINFCYDYKKQDFKSPIAFLLLISPMSFSFVFSLLNNFFVIEFLVLFLIAIFVLTPVYYVVFFKLFELIINILNLKFCFYDKVENKEKFLFLKKIKNLSENERGEDSKLLIEIFDYLKTEERKVVFDEFEKIIYTNLEEIENNQIKQREEKLKQKEEELKQREEELKQREELHYKKELEKINKEEEINIKEKEDIFSIAENLKNNRKFKV